MPVVNVKLIEGVFTREQKQEMIRRMTDVIADWKGSTCALIPWWSSTR